MPTYEYACSECGGRFEAVQKITDDPLTVCAMCGAAAIRRVIFPVGIVFKGAGFHINDYAKSGGPASGSGDASKTESGDAPKTEAKSEAGDSSKSEKEPAASATDSEK